MLTLLDYGVIAFYFIFMSSLGWYFRRGNSDSSDYFRAGGIMPWWLAGASAFMGAFSAWTFTGAAGIAYEGGFVAIIIYWANSVGFAVAALWFAARFRQTRSISVIEVIRQRLGATNEQIVVWLGIPLALARAAIWLYGLAIFISPVFGLEVRTVIIVCGIVVVLVSALGGAHAVVAGDFMQALLLIPITIIMAVLALERTNGVSALIEKLPPGHLDLIASNLPGFGLFWLVALLFEKILFGNNVSSAGRYLCVRDSREARRAASFAAVLFLVGSVLWFIPAFAARALNLDLGALFPGIAKPSETAYAAMAVLTLPSGLLGLLVTGLIATTLSSMDSGLNANAGTFVRGVYRPLLRPKASEKELVRAGQLTTAALGAAIVLLALEYSSWRNVGVFSLMFNLSAMLLAPGAVPLFWCLFTRRSPDWAVWSSELLGFANSAAILWLPGTAWFASAHILSPDQVAWLHTNEYSVTMVSNTLLCSAWFWIVTCFGPSPRPARQDEINALFAAIDRPIQANETAGAIGPLARSIARLCLVYGGFITVVAILPNSLRGHLGLFFCAAFMGVVGFVIHRLHRASTVRLASVNPTSETSPSSSP